MSVPREGQDLHLPLESREARKRRLDVMRRDVDAFAESVRANGPSEPNFKLDYDYRAGQRLGFIYGLVVGALGIAILGVFVLGDLASG
jgi:hypothetical protein